MVSVTFGNVAFLNRCRSSLQRKCLNTCTVKLSFPRRKVVLKYGGKTGEVFSGLFRDLWQLSLNEFASECQKRVKEDVCKIWLPFYFFFSFL